MFPLTPAVRAYAWGSRTAIPQLCGSDKPAPHPIAEYWFGAHDSGPSTAPDGRGLNAVIAADPEGQLGPVAPVEGSAVLPYLVKLLAAEQALSLQAHPSRAQARQGFAAENARGLELDAADRNYRDDNHKPELLIALTPFAALAGFRRVADTIALLDALGVSSFAPYRELLAGEPDAAGLRVVFTTFVTLPPATVHTLVSDLVVGCVSLLAAKGSGHRWSSVASTIVELGERYPADAGVLGALLLNRLDLNPGEGVYLGAGNLHAYLHGTGVEVMANSDNVLRGGLTPKHVDVPELLRVLDFEPLVDPVVRPVHGPEDVLGEASYPVPAEEFAVSRIDLGAEVDHASLAVRGPEVLLVTHGSAEVICMSDGGSCSVEAGSAVWVPASSGRIEVRSSSFAEVFRTRIGAD